MQALVRVKSGVFDDKWCGQSLVGVVCESMSVPTEDTWLTR